MSIQMKHKLYYLLFLVLVSLDQFTKQIFMSSYDLGQSVAVNSYLSWTYLQNTGAAFSIMADGGFIQKTFLLSVSVLVSIWVIFWIQEPRLYIFKNCSVSFFCFLALLET